MIMLVNPDAYAEWLARKLPPATLPYARLMRLDKPAGIWPLLLPCWWSLALAGPRLADLWLAPLFAIGAIVMRGAGCVINDIFDRNYDRLVERTHGRPLASGEISLPGALLFLAGLLLIGLLILLTFNPFAVGLGVASLVLVVLYPLAKRFTWWPQLFLGFTFNWGALLGWAAADGTIGLPAIPLYIAGIFWTLGYDTIYAYQDRNDDLLAGIKSTALLFGEKPMPWVALFYALAIAFLALAGLAAGLSGSYFEVLVGAAAFAAVQLALWKPDDVENCLRRFRSSREFGLIVLAAILIGKFL